MATITNTGVWPVPLSGYVLKRGEALSLSNADLDRIDMARALPALIATGDVDVIRDPDAPVSLGQPEAMPARYADDDDSPVGIPEVSPARFADETPALVAVATPEAAPEPETPADEPADIEKGA